VAGSERTVMRSTITTAASSGSFNFQAVGTLSAIFPLLQGTVYKVRAWNSDGNTQAGLISDTNGRSALSYTSLNVSTFVGYSWVDGANNVLAGSNEAIDMHATSALEEGSSSIATAIITPSADTIVKVRITTLGLAGAANAEVDASRSFAEITQIGTTAVTTTQLDRVNVIKGTTQSVPANTEVIITSYNAVSAPFINLQNNFNVSTGLYTVPRAGRYRVTCQHDTGSAVSWVSTSSIWGVRIYKNTTANIVGQGRSSPAVISSCLVSTPTAVAIIDCVPGDTISGGAFQNSGTGYTVGFTSFTVEELPTNA
jgi:hypothetical protein